MTEKRYSFFNFRLYHRNEETPTIEMFLLRSKKPPYISILTILLYCFAAFFQCRHEVIAQIGNVSFSADAGLAFWTQDIVINRLSNVGIPSDVPSITSSKPYEQFIRVKFGSEFGELFQVALGASFGITNFSAIGNEPSTFAINGRPAAGIIKHSTDTYVNGITLFPTISLNIFKSLRAGIEIPYYIPVYSFSRHNQEITEPTELKGSQLSNESEEHVTRESFGSWFALGFFAGYSFPLNKAGTLALTPTIGIRKMVQSPIVSNSALPITVNTSIGVEYRFIKTIREQFYDSVFTKNDTLLVLGAVRSRDTVLYTEQIVDSVKDITLENASIRRTYIHKLYKHSVPKKVSVLTGQIHATFFDSSNDKSKEMQEAVSLTEIYDIAQCTILADEKSNLDDIPKSVFSRANMKENKSEKIKSLTFSDTLSLIYPSIIRLKHNAVSEAGLQSWKIRLEQNNTLLKEINGQSELGNYTDININELNIQGKGTELICKLILRDYEDNEFTTQNTRIKLILGTMEHIDTSHSVEIYFVDEKVHKKRYKDFLPQTLSDSLIRFDDMKTIFEQNAESPIMRFRKQQWMNRFPYLHKYLFCLQVLP